MILIVMLPNCTICKCSCCTSLCSQLVSAAPLWPEMVKCSSVEKTFFHWFFTFFLYFSSSHSLVTIHRWLNRSVLCSRPDVCEDVGELWFRSRLKRHEVRRRTEQQMTGQKGVSDGGSAREKRWKWSSSWTRGGLSFLGWSETISRGQLYRAENPTAQQRRRTKVNPRRNLQHRNESRARREFSQRAESPHRVCWTCCAGKNWTATKIRTAGSRLVLGVCSVCGSCCFGWLVC